MKSIKFFAHLILISIVVATSLTACPNDIDTLQKVRGDESEKYSYANDYQIIASLKALTDSIMARLPERPVERPNRVWMAVRTISALAAAWLIGLFIYQQLTDKRALQGSTSYVADQPQGNVLKDAYLRSMQKERQQPLSYTFVKKYINEKR